MVPPWGQLVACLSSRQELQILGSQTGRKGNPTSTEISRVATAGLGATGLAHILPAEGMEIRILFTD